MKQNLKYFNMLEFKPHPFDSSGFLKRAIIFFDNGYGASIVTGSIAYTDEDHPYELAILKGNEYNHSICYDTYLTNDVIGYCNAEKINDLLEKISKLPTKHGNKIHVFGHDTKVNIIISPSKVDSMIILKDKTHDLKIILPKYKLEQLYDYIGYELYDKRFEDEHGNQF